MKSEHVVHSFEPIFDSRSAVLILGSLPSVKSRETSFYYGHPQNRFWRVIAAVTDEAVPVTVEEKKSLLLTHGIAIWDVIAECDIVGSSDASVRNVIPADIRMILDRSPIRAIFCNGGTAGRIYRKYQFPLTGKEAVALPSTSPANAAWQLPELTEKWKEALRVFLRGR